ncbi:PAN/Apple domain-containing protein [Robiginitomaculum antarcticum]|uniref:hypothetical protein n=1 Tax=Robiginitomaculum antarcticum TaxID=437507 RepID=UPI000372F2B6|nr:hypothetical protein [Robiginitomaculum antarcticum]
MRAALIIFAVTFTLPIAASDLNTYRSGQIYAATPAPSAQICEMQCAGDAQCRGWNFLPSRAVNHAGRCELNATSGLAMSHPYAQSGAALVAQPAARGRLIQAGTHTTQIGRPVPTAPPVIRRQVRIAPRALPVVPPRQSQPPVTSPARYRAPLAGISRPAPLMSPAPVTPIYRPMPMQPNAGIQRQITPLPQPVQAAPVARPSPAQPAPIVRPLNMPNPVPQIMAAPYNPAPAMDRLYGSLYDDNAPPQQRMPLYSERPNEDPDRPVVTTVPLPAIAVNMQAMPLAGGMPH